MTKEKELPKTSLQNAMQEVSELNEKGIKVQGGKKYTQVVTRVEVFRKHFDFQYGIETGIFEFAGGFMAKAVIRDLGTDKVIGTGHSFATSIAKEKSVEKFETTAIGRALASCGLSGGEYATQDEIETHEERYQETSREDKAFMRDFLYALGNTDDVPSLIEEMGDRFDSLSDEMNEQITGQLEIRRSQIKNNIKAIPPKFTFLDVHEAVEFAKEANEIINDPKKSYKEISNWMLENDHKAKALDVSLKAGKYQTPEGTPYQRLVNAYNKRQPLAAE